MCHFFRCCNDLLAFLPWEAAFSVIPAYVFTWTGGLTVPLRCRGKVLASLMTRLVPPTIVRSSSFSVRTMDNGRGWTSSRSIRFLLFSMFLSRLFFSIVRCFFLSSVWPTFPVWSDLFLFRRPFSVVLFWAIAFFLFVPVTFLVIHCIRSLCNKLLGSSISPAILIPSICQHYRWSTWVITSLLCRPGDSERDLVSPWSSGDRRPRFSSRAEGPSHNRLCYLLRNSSRWWNMEK